MRIMPSETQKHTHCPSIFFCLLGKYITESFRYQHIQISFILFHTCQEFHCVELLQFVWGSFPTKKAFEASGIINNPPDLMITNRIANLWPYASCIVLSTLQVRWSPFIMVTVLWGTYYCHFTDKEQHSGYLSQVTKKMTKQALSPSLTQSPHPSRVPQPFVKHLIELAFFPQDKLLVGSLGQRAHILYCGRGQRRLHQIHSCDEQCILQFPHCWWKGEGKSFAFFKTVSKGECRSLVLSCLFVLL